MLKKLLTGMLLTLSLFGCGSDPKSDPGHYTTIGQGPVTIYINNESTMDNNKLARVVAAVNNQLQKELKPLWGIDAQLLPGQGSRQLNILNDLTRFPQNVNPATGGPLATGFHQSGSLGWVGIKECENEIVFSVTVSHEILEMLANPNANRSASEICDPVGSARYSYVNPEFPDIAVSDFVYPSFYQAFLGAPFDRKGIITAAMTPAPGHNIFDGIGLKKLETPTRKSPHRHGTW